MEGMTTVKKSPRTATTIKIRSKSEYFVSHSRDPYQELMLRLFQEETTALRGRRFLTVIENRQKEGRPLRTSEWKQIMAELGVSRSAFYAMRNKLLGAGLISNRGGEYKLSGTFSRDLMDMARWWWTAILGNSPENL